MSIGKTEFVSRPYTKEYDEGWERIFGKKKKEITVGEWRNKGTTTPYKPVAK